MTSSLAIKVHAGRSGHGRSLHRRRPRSITGSRRRASCSSRSPGWRCSIRACSSSPACSAADRLTRAIHPWIGVVLFFSFLGLFLRFWKANLWKAEDGTWLARLRDVLSGARRTTARGRQIQCRPEDGVLVDVDPDHRADLQRPADLGPILRAIFDRRTEAHRRARSTHCAAVAIICVWIVHVYAAIWVRGTIGAMTRGPGHRRLGVAASPQMAARTGQASVNEQ